MTVLTVTNLPAAVHGETVRCLFAIELSRIAAPSVDRFAATGLDRAPKSVTKRFQDR